ncbi:metal-dependent hydrolase [Hymenobacter sp. BT635]|uniref:Metal-dependent hydrolase n=1 Tax=Hymenobacter nitidus TaxID=2880929 RepID=A0ABS8AEL0_9BACT|nr:metal-dependent hydrolase [Hymenobacter nitidus]MCB2378840.1 metal-dependent hydrolase [Hymenobacter nitidus]
MFIGHYGLAFGAKATKPQLSLGLLFMAVQLADLLWPTLLLLGLERVELQPSAGQAITFSHYPISHSLLMSVVWSLLLGLGYWVLRRDKPAALLLAFSVLSHWLLDAVVHGPDLPLYPGHSPLVGLGLWNNLLLSQVLEVPIFVAGLYMYLRRTQAINKTGRYALWSLVAFLVLVHFGNFFSPTPGSITELGWAGQLMWLPVLWAYWADRNRTVRTAGLAISETRPASAPSIS